MRKSWAGRSAKVAKLGAKVGSTYASTAARKVFASAERRVELDSAREMKTASAVAEQLGQMKGALMKLGQMASYLDEGLPEPMRLALAQLRSDAPPMSSALAAQVIEQELGGPPDEIFVEWDPQPIAAASIGQVHRAIAVDPATGNQVPVAVKVQYPGVDEAITADLKNAGMLGTILKQGFGGLDPDEMVAEIKERLVEELDYRLEARHQAEFAEYYRHHPVIHVPDVLPMYSTGRVLTSELVNGATWDEMLTWDKTERDLAGETIFRFVFRSLYLMRAFNGDPHPGNYLFGADGRVTFLDFGLVKRFTDPELRAFSDMVEAIAVAHDPARFRRVVEAVGLLPAGHPSSDAEIVDYFGHFYELVMAKGPSTITGEYASESVRRIFDTSGGHAAIQKAANLPPSFVIIQRINLGLYAVLGELGATADWRRICEELWPFVDGPPSTPIGEAEAEWVARRRRDGTAPGPA